MLSGWDHPVPTALGQFARGGVRCRPWNGTGICWKEVVRVSVVVAIVCPEGAVLACDSRETDANYNVTDDSRRKWAESDKSASPRFIAAWTGALRGNKTQLAVEDIIDGVLRATPPPADVEEAAEGVCDALAAARDGSEGGTYVFIAGPSRSGNPVELWYVEAPPNVVAATWRRHWGCLCKVHRGNDDVRTSLSAHDEWVRCVLCALRLGEAQAVCRNAVTHVIDDIHVPSVGGSCTVLTVPV